MTPRARSLLVTIACALVAGFVGVALGKIGFDRATRETGLHEVVHDVLSLTPEQLREIEALETDFRGIRESREGEMRSANADLAAAIRDEGAYGPRVTAAVQRFHDAMGRLQIETIEHVFAMRAVLTPDQAAIFDDTVESALIAETP